MTNHAPELIRFLDQHWCARMAEQANLDPLGDTPEESLRKLDELRRAFLSDLANMPKEQAKR